MSATTLDQLFHLLKDPDCRARLAAVAELATRRGSQVSAALQHALVDEDYDVRTRAWEGLVQIYRLAPLIAGPDGVRTQSSSIELANALLTSDLPGFVRIGADEIRAIIRELDAGATPASLGIAWSAEPDAVDEVRGVLFEPDQPFPLDAVAALSGVGRRKAEQIIALRLDERDPRVPEALARLGATWALPALQEIASAEDTSDELRASVRASIAALQGDPAPADPPAPRRRPDRSRLGLWDRRDVHEHVEARAGEVGPDGSWPVVVVSRGDGAPMVTFQVREVDGRLDATYTTANPEFHDPLVPEIFLHAYLATCCDHAYQGRIARIALRRADGAAVHELAYPRWLDPATIDRELEASCGDVDADGWSPGFISQRGSGKAVIRLRQQDGYDWMDVHYTVLDDSLDDHDVKEIFIQTFLYTFTDHYYEDRMSTIRLHRDDDSVTMSFRYPRPIG